MAKEFEKIQLWGLSLSKYLEWYDFTLHIFFPFERKRLHFVFEIVLTYCEKDYSSDVERLLKLKAEG